MAATMTRTDIHRPSAPEFDPEGYDCHGVFDLNTSAADYVPDNRVATVSRLVSEGHRFTSVHGSYACGHCGTRIRYGALMVHRDTKGMIYVGETCLDNRFELTKGEFQALRAASALNRDRLAKSAKIDALLAEHPALVWGSYAHNIEVAGGERVFYIRDDFEGTEYATEAEARAALPAHWMNDFWAVGEGFKRGTTLGEQARIGWEISTLSDIWHKIEKYGDPSDKQIQFALSLVDKISAKAEEAVAREAAKAALAATGVEVPVGRITVEGVVLSTKYKENQYGSTLKMLVQHESGWKVWGSVPSSIEVDKGTRVRFTATVRKSDDDVLFGFFSRPVKAQVL